MRNIASPFRINVSPSERAISLFAGAYFLYDALVGNKKNWGETALAGYLLYRGFTGNCVGYSAIGKTKPDNRSRNVNIQVRQIVQRPKQEVYEFWRNFENLPLFMGHLEDVQRMHDSIYEWTAKIPGGIGKIQWKSEIVKERPFDMVGWHSVPNASIENAGKVTFKAISDHATEVHVVVSYHAPGGIPGEGAARMINPIFENILEEDIMNFKQFAERNIPLG